MADLEREINDRITDFVAELTTLVRTSTLAAVSQALTEHGRGAHLKAALARGRARGAAMAARPPGAKRSSTELAATSRRLLAYVRGHAGQRVEQIVKAIGIPTKDLALPIKKLISGGQIRTTGQRRATRYFPGGKAAKPARRKARAKK